MNYPRIKDRASIAHVGGAAAAALLAVLLSSESALSSDGTAAGLNRRWSKPEVVLSTRHHPVSGVQIAAGRRQYAVILWRSGHSPPIPAARAQNSGNSRVLASVRRPSARRFGRPSAISPKGAVDAALGMSADGQTIATWTDSAGSLRAIFRGPNTRWKQEQVLSGSGVSNSAMAIAPDGTAAVAWAQVSPSGTEQVWTSVRPSGGRFGPSMMIPGASAIGSQGPFAATANTGLAAVVWSRQCGVSRRETAQGSIRSPLPGPPAPRLLFRPPEPIPNSECPNAGLDIAIDDRGAVIVLVNGFLARAVVKASVRPPNGTFSKAERISRKGEEANFARVGIDGSGRAVVVWSRFRRSLPHGIAVTVREPDARFSPPRRISGRRGGGLHDLAVNHRGSAVAVWQSLRSHRLRASYMRPGREFRHRERVSPPLPRTGLASPSVALTPGGKAVVAWGQPGARGDVGVFVAERRRG